MQLYLLRHANADTVAENDDERQLSEKGILQTQRVARFCEAHEITPSVLLTSPIRRAHQTARLVSEHLRVDMQLARWLACGATPEDILSELYVLREQPSVMLVGHEPDFSAFAAFLLGAKHRNAFHIRKGSLTLFTLHEFAMGGGQLEFSIPPKLV